MQCVCVTWSNSYAYITLGMAQPNTPASSCLSSSPNY
uniref:Uncharacterized protein n=1 Tax=Anguilla anguilla TaxID=7936 RepID=A0A0E9XFT0_ANGAN